MIVLLAQTAVISSLYFLLSNQCLLCRAQRTRTGGENSSFVMRAMIYCYWAVHSCMCVRVCACVCAFLWVYICNWIGLGVCFFRNERNDTLSLLIPIDRWYISSSATDMFIQTHKLWFVCVCVCVWCCKCLYFVLFCCEHHMPLYKIRSVADDEYKLDCACSNLCYLLACTIIQV